MGLPVCHVRSWRPREGGTGGAAPRPSGAGKPAEAPTPNDQRQRPGALARRASAGHGTIVSCVRCRAVMVVTERIADAERRGIVIQLRGCIPDLFRRARAADV